MNTVVFFIFTKREEFSIDALSTGKVQIAASEWCCQRGGEAAIGQLLGDER